MNSRTPEQQRDDAAGAAEDHRKRSRLLPALLAGSACGLAADPISAVQLGELEVQSALGKPLRASIAYALSPNEQLASYCIFLNPQVPADGLPVLSRATLTVANGRININGSVPIKEPILSLGLTIDCPYTANLTRSYTLMLDPAQPSVAPMAERDRQDVAAVNRPVAAPRPRSVPADDAPIALTGSYRVRYGDSLSMIAARLEDRPVGLWQAVDALFAANPDAFIDGDMNKLKAGSLLRIPSFDGATVPVVSDPATPAAATDATSTTAYPGFDAAADAADTEPAIAQAVNDSVEEVANEAAEQAVDEPAAETASVDTVPIAAAPADTSVVPAADLAPADQTDELRPGDVLVGTDRPFVSPIDSTEVAAEQPTTGESRTLLYWLGGAGAALILGLLLFGRRLRGRFGPTAAPSQADDRIADDEPTARNRALSEVDFELGEDAAAPSLDADLSAGTGLKFGADIEVAEDFGFSTSRDLGADVDLLIPAGAETEPDAPSTDILPPQRRGEDTILEREILPSDYDDEYDLSMVVDATQQKFDDGDITAKELTAVPVSTDADDEVGGDYTLSNEIDYKILEQDYEDELTATQALNAEISKAAVALAERLGDTQELASVDDELEITSEQTARMQTEDDDEPEEELSDLDDTGINEAIPIETPGDDPETGDDTAESTFEGTVEMHGRLRRHRFSEETSANTELTEELPSAENDPTVEMDVESGHVNTKKSVG